MWKPSACKPNAWVDQSGVKTRIDYRILRRIAATATVVVSLTWDGGVHGLTQLSHDNPNSAMLWAAAPQLPVKPVEDPVVPDSKALQTLDQQVDEADMTLSKTTDWPNLFGPGYGCEVPWIQDVEEWSEKGPERLWEVRAGTGYSSPIVVNGNVFSLDRFDEEEIMHCRSMANGEVVWEYHYPTDFKCKTYYSSGPYSNPASDGELIYGIGAEGQLYCLDIKTGKERWKRDLRSEFDIHFRIYSVGHSPLIWRDMLIVNVGGKAKNSGIVCFNRFTGAVVWQSTDVDYSYSMPIVARIHGKDFLFVLAYEALVALDPADGREYWRIPMKVRISDAENAVTPLVVDDLQVINSYGNGTVCLRIAANGSYTLVRDGRKSLTSQFSPVIHRDGYLYGFHSGDNSLRCVALESGDLMWRLKGKLTRSTAGVFGESILYLDDKSRLGLLAIDPKEGRLRVLSDPLFENVHLCAASPAFYADKMVVHVEGSLTCFQLKIKTSEME